MKSIFFWVLGPIVLFTYTQSCTASEHGNFDMKNWTASSDLEAERKQLHRLHSRCAVAAEERILTAQEANGCIDIYLRLKLSFLPGAEVGRFKTLSPATRALANQKAYAAYRAWHHRQLNFLGTGGTSSLGPERQ